MSERRYGALILDVPANYDDESLVVLRPPQQAPLVAMRVATKQALRPSFVVKRTVLGSDAPPLSALAELEERTLLQTVPGVKIVGKGEEGGGVFFECCFDSPEGKIRQVQLTRILGRTACCFVATALDDTGFADVKKQLLALAASAKVE